MQEAPSFSTMHMIKPAFLKAQIEKSRRSRRTSSFLRRLIFSSAHEVARNWYADDYPTRCLQTSCAVQALLKRFGIQSEIWLGALCTAGIYTDPPGATWAGFWDQDHHLWLRTEFNEFVDLSASQLHLHARSIRTGGVGMPAIWWDDINQWPSVIRYLPDTRIDSVRLPDAKDQADLEAFCLAVEAFLDQRMNTEAVEQIVFGPILDNVDTLNRLTKQGHPWVCGALAYQNIDAEFPPWIEERERELQEAYLHGQRPPSRLAARHDLLEQRSTQEVTN